MSRGPDDHKFPPLGPRTELGKINDWRLWLTEGCEEMMRNGKQKTGMHLTGSTVNLRGCILADTIYGQLYYLTPLAADFITNNSVPVHDTEIRCARTECISGQTERQKATSLKKKYDVISCFLHNGASCGGSANWQDTEKGNITDRNPGRVHDGPLAHVDKGTSVHHAQ